MNRKSRYPVNRQLVIEDLSSKRLSSYLIFPPNREIDTIFAYDYMQRISACLFLPLQYLEITLRNRIYKELVRHYKWRRKKYPTLGIPEDWLEWMPASPIAKTKIQQVKISLKGKLITPDNIISNLSFGFWVNILQEYPNQNSLYHFWIFTHKRIFPNANGIVKEFICKELKEICDIRNRLFHYEPIWTGVVKQNYYSAILEVIRKYKRVMRAINWLSIDIYNLLKRQRHEHYLAKYALQFYRIFRGIDKYNVPFNI